MRFRIGFVVLGLAVLAAGLSRGAAAPDPVRVDPALGSLVRQEGLFTFQAPKGWKVATGPEHDFPACIGPAQAGGSVPSIEPGQQGYESVDTFAEAVTRNTGDVQTLDKRKFVTDAGVTGQRIVARKGGSQEVVIYAFSGKNGLLLTFTGSCAPVDDQQLRPVFDASMKSLVLEM